MPRRIRRASAGVLLGLELLGSTTAATARPQAVTKTVSAAERRAMFQSQESVWLQQILTPDELEAYNQWLANAEMQQATTALTDRINQYRLSNGRAALQLSHLVRAQAHRTNEWQTIHNVMCHFDSQPAEAKGKFARSWSDDNRCSVMFPQSYQETPLSGRKNLGLMALKLNPVLRDMLAQETGVGTQPLRLENTGYCNTDTKIPAPDEIANSIFDMWQNSPRHNAAMLAGGRVYGAVVVDESLITNPQNPLALPVHEYHATMQLAV